MILTLKSPFSSAHFYHQPAWDDERNRTTFGRCFTPYGHGHNYTLEVSFQVSPGTWLTERSELQNLLNSLTTVLDHEHLNFVIPEFQQKVPTTENIALYFMDKIQAHLPADKIVRLRLFEMDNLWTEITP